MKVMRKRLPVFLLVLLLVAALLPTAAFAAGRIDMDEPETLTIRFQKEGAVPGVRFDLYKVAEVSETGRITDLTEKFAPYGDSVTGLKKLEEQENQDNWMALAETLKNCLKPETTPDESGETDTEGNLVFSDLTPGLYLVIGFRQTVGDYIYTVSPFMTFLPALDYENNVWEYTYDAVVAPKASRQPVPLPPPPPPSPPPGDKETLTRKVLKVWQDDDNAYERPQEITVSLLENGSVYDTVTLNAGNNWRHTWTELSADSEWTLTEIPVENYTMQIEQDGVTFVVKNTYNPPEEEFEEEETPQGDYTPEEEFEEEVPLAYLPQTGVLWWPVPLMLCLGIILLTVGTLCRRRDEK